MMPLARRVPLTEWHRKQKESWLMNSSSPSLASGSTGPDASASCSFTQALKSSHDSATTLKRMLACETPQNSAHCA